MPIFTKVESKTPGGRIFHGITILLLTLGGITMIYPFLLMLSGSIRTEMDETDLDIIPDFLVNEDVLYQKFLEFKYEQDVGQLNRAHLERVFSFKRASAPDKIPERVVADFETFFAEAELPPHWQMLAGVAGQQTVPEHLRELRQRVEKKYEGDIRAFSRDIGTSVDSWKQVSMSTPQWMSGSYDPAENVIFETYYEMLREADYAERQLTSLSGFFLEFVVYPRFGTLEAYNEAFERKLRDFSDFRLPQTVPPEDEPKMREEWLDFVIKDLNASFIVLDGVPDERFRDFLRQEYSGIDEVNLSWRRDYESFGEIELPRGREFLFGSFRQDYLDFIRGIDPGHIRLVGPEFAWRDWLRENFADVAEMNEAYGTDADSFRDVWLPFKEQERAYVAERPGDLRWSFAVRNYINVFDAALFEGRAFINTVIFTALAVITSLLVNPLTAYGLSRFKLPGTYKILLLLMATMAFPPMVTTIPVFLMMKDLGLMNTFAGILLPTIANGYMIFLLKGFFDSLPQELYEAALIDGASEFRMFFSITLALSKPVLAVVGLMTFNSAYTVFLFALIVAPAEEMWLLSVWLYQYRETVSQGGVFASVVLASIPPILIFIFAQNIILRGIVVPMEK